MSEGVDKPNEQAVRMAERGLEMDANVQSVVKAYALGTSTGEFHGTAAKDVEELEQFYGLHDIIPPAYEPWLLQLLYEHSNALRQCVDAYISNIDSHGHELRPLIDVDSERTQEQVVEAILTKLFHKRYQDGDPVDPDSFEAPTDEEIEEYIDRLKIRSTVEKVKAKTFFATCCPDPQWSWNKVRKAVRQDKETIGYGGMEVLRNKQGEPRESHHVPGVTIRIRRTVSRVKIPEARYLVGSTWITMKNVYRRFRSYVQVTRTGAFSPVYFKEYGDPRVMSRTTGKFFGEGDKGVKELQKEEGKQALPATEILLFKIHSGRSPYGIPRWIGNVLSVMGSRQSEEVNFLYFDNKSVPPMALLVAGGTVKKDSVDTLKHFIQNEIKGRENFHKILIIEAEPARAMQAGEPHPKMQLKLVPLTAAQHSDALFQNYDSRNIDKVGASMRVPGILRGDTRKLNYATSEAAGRFFENQVAEPEREDFDETICRTIMADLGIECWRFETMSPINRDPERLTKMVSALVKGGVMTPAEGREVAEDIFNRQFKRVPGEWANFPSQVYLAMLRAQAGPQGGAGGGAPISLEELFANEDELGFDGREGRILGDSLSGLFSLGEALKGVEDGAEDLLDNLAARLESEKITVPSSQLEQWITPAGGEVETE